MIEYHELLKSLLEAPQKSDRTGTGTRSIPLHVMNLETDFGRTFNIVTSKEVMTRSVLAELIGFIRGVDNSEVFKKMGCGVWNANANKEGNPGHPNKWLTNPFRKGENDLGRIYGVQWRYWRDVQIGMENYDDHFADAGYEYVGTISDIGTNHRRTVWEREIDQLANAIETIKNTPDSRRIIISAWNPADLDKMALPPCHVLQQYLCEEMTLADRVQAAQYRMVLNAMWQIRDTDPTFTEGYNHIRSDEDTETAYNLLFNCGHDSLDRLGVARYKLHLNMCQRSADTLLGVPFNIASYNAMLLLMARVTGTAPGTLNYITGDTHLYENHIAAAKEQLERAAVENRIGNGATLLVNPSICTLGDLEEMTVDDFYVSNYKHCGKLTTPTPMAV